jgi:outer membrane biosynthesis protein TonB
MKNILLRLMFAVFVIGSFSVVFFTLFGENNQTTNTNIDKTQTIEKNNTNDTWGTLETTQPTPEAIVEETTQPTPEAIVEETTQPTPEAIVEETPQPTPEAIVEETKQECIDRVTNELIERDRGEVVTQSKMEAYMLVYRVRCNLTPNR